MKRNLMSILLIAVLLLQCIPAYAVDDGIMICFQYSGSGRKTDYSFDWDSSIKEVTSPLKGKAGESKLPYWGDPSKTTDENAGYVISLGSFGTSASNYENLGVEKVNIYFSYAYNENGADNTQDSAQLYMAVFTIDRFTDMNRVDGFISSMTEKYGNPIFYETTGSSNVSHGNGWEELTYYNRNYLWGFNNGTGLRITYTYEPWAYRYSKVMVYIGCTDMDPTLRTGKLSDVRQFVQAVVVSDSVPFYNADGQHSLNLDSGTSVMITGYDSAKGLFPAEVIVRKSTFTVTDSGVRGSGTATTYEGFVDGACLNVQKDELMHYYLEDASAIPVPESIKESEKNSSPESLSSASYTHSYVLNTNTMKFHEPYCSSVRRIAAYNRAVVEMTYEDAIALGYRPCQICRP